MNTIYIYIRVTLTIMKISYFRIIKIGNSGFTSHFSNGIINISTRICYLEEKLVAS